MNLHMMKSKIHRAYVTEANLNYVGSITIDGLLMEASAIHENEQVHVLNIANGERFVTYAIKGASGSGVICLNGACARLCQVDDRVIIISYCSLDSSLIPSHKPVVVSIGSDNRDFIKLTDSE